MECYDGALGLRSETVTARNRVRETRSDGSAGAPAGNHRLYRRPKMAR
jgi:hypothetical protein